MMVLLKPINSTNSQTATKLQQAGNAKPKNTRTAKSRSRTPEAETQSDCNSSEFKVSEINRIIGTFDVFPSMDGMPWIKFERNGHYETHEVTSENFRVYLLNHYIDSGCFPSTQTVADIIDGIAIKIRSSKQLTPRAVGTRVLRIGNSICIDLGNEDWEYVEITPYRYDIRKLTKESPVAFRRTAFTRALPKPIPFEAASGREVNRLLELLNVADDQSGKMVIIFILMSLSGRGPYPILTLSGSEGSGKSTAARIIHLLIDPSQNLLAAPPKSEDDLCVLAENQFIVSLENVSGFAKWLPDLLCRLATGFSFTKRKLYTNAVLWACFLQNPSILNGIDVQSTRGDLASRICPARFQKKMIDGKEVFDPRIMEKFEAALPIILGAIYRGMCCGLKAEGKDGSMGRFDAFAIGAEAEFGWPEGSVKSAFQSKQEEGAGDVIDASFLACAIRDNIDELIKETHKNHLSSLSAVDERITWVGDATELKEDLDALDPRCRMHVKDSPKAVRTELIRITDVLRKQGIIVEMNPKRVGPDRKRLILISKA